MMCSKPTLDNTIIVIILAKYCLFYNYGFFENKKMKKMKKNEKMKKNFLTTYI